MNTKESPQAFTLGAKELHSNNVLFCGLLSVWRTIKASELVLNTTSDVFVATAVKLSNEEDFEVFISTTTTCTDVSTAPVLAAFIAVPGNWARIKFQQTFKETQHCYAIFGNVPTW